MRSEPLLYLKAVSTKAKIWRIKVWKRRVLVAEEVERAVDHLLTG